MSFIQIQVKIPRSLMSVLPLKYHPFLFWNNVGNNESWTCLAEQIYWFFFLQGLLFKSEFEEGIKKLFLKCHLLEILWFPENGRSLDFPLCLVFPVGFLQNSFKKLAHPSEFLRSSLGYWARCQGIRSKIWNCVAWWLLLGPHTTSHVCISTNANAYCASVSSRD